MNYALILSKFFSYNFGWKKATENKNYKKNENFNIIYRNIHELPSAFNYYLLVDSLKINFFFKNTFAFFSFFIFMHL